MKKLKVCLVGIYYPLAMLRYFENALLRRDDIELVRAGPYTGQFIPWANGMMMLPKYAKSPEIALPTSAIQIGKVNPQLLVQMAGGRLDDVDVWIEVDAGFHLDPKPKNGIVAHVATDPHCLNYDRQRQLADHFFCMQTPYMKPGDHYLPYAYDPVYHTPIEFPDKKYDAGISGLHYAQRTNLVNRLRERELNVYYDIGPIFDEYRALVNSLKVGLNWSSLLDMNARVWELAAMRVCPVENTVPDMPTFFVAGEHYLDFSDLNGAVSQTLLAVNDAEMREEIANNAYRKVTQGKNTYDDRIEQILSTCKVI